MSVKVEGFIFLEEDGTLACIIPEEIGNHLTRSRLYQKVEEGRKTGKTLAEKTLLDGENLEQFKQRLKQIATQIKQQRNLK